MMFLFQTSLVEAKADISVKLKEIPTDILQRISSRKLTDADLIFLRNKHTELLATAGNSENLLSALGAICKGKASLATKTAAAYLYGFGSKVTHRRLDISKGVIKNVFQTDLMKASFETQFDNKELAKAALYGAEDQISISFSKTPETQAKASGTSFGDLPKSVPMNTSFGGTKVYFDYSPQTINPPGIKLSATLPLNMDFSWGMPGAEKFKDLYNFYQENFSTTSFSSLAAKKPEYAPLVDAWLDAPFSPNGSETVRDVLAKEVKDGRVDEFIALLKNFRSNEAFALLRSDEGYNRIYTALGIGKMEYNALITNVVQSDFAKRASGKISGHTSITVDVSKRFSLLGYFDYNNVRVKAIDELPGKRINFFDAGGMLVFHARNIVLDVGAGYQWGKTNVEDVATIPLNAFYLRADVDKTIPLPRFFKMGLAGTFTQTFFEGENAFSSARVGAKASKTIPIKSMDLDIYVNPFVDLDVNQGKISKDFTIRTGIDLKKIPIPKGFMTVGAYYDFLKKDAGAIRVTYHF
jgi:hypothetical protein